MKEYTYGDYNYPEVLNAPVVSQVSITLQPADLLSYWKRVGTLSDFVSLFYSFSLNMDYALHNQEYEQKEISEDQKKLFMDSVSTIFNELIENGAKFSTNKRRHLTIFLKKYPTVLTLEVENYTDKNSFYNYQKIVRGIFEAEDLDELYFQKLEENAEKQDGGSGIGLLMIVKDFPVKLGTKFIEIDDQYLVKTSSHYLVEI